VTSEEKLERLRLLKKRALLEGGPEQAAARRKSELMSARERVLGVLDTGSFVELDVLVDGVVTGHGRVNGREVFLFSQEPAEADGFSAERFAQKTVKVLDLAMKSGMPLVGIYDAGERWGRESMGALGAYADIFFRTAMASGVVPQIAAIMGPCGGPAAYSPVLADFTLMVKGSSQLFLTGPDVAREVSGEEATIEQLGGGRTHSEKSGIAHLAADDEGACLEAVRGLLSYLPQNNLEEAPRVPCTDPADRRDEGLQTNMPGAAAGDNAGDIKEIISRVIDGGEFLELQAKWARNVVIGFARLNGRAVGIVANQPAQLGGRLDIDGSAKAARFVRTCDAFNVPLLTFVDTPGFQPGKAQECAGLLRHAAKLLYAYCEATVPKLTVITGRAQGEAYEVMCSKNIRADFNLAWPSAQIAASTGGTAGRRWEAHSPFTAAKRGYLDDVIEPRDTRPRLVAALEACASKREGRPPKKHGNIPL
jgi:propionyl-CoA/long-chain acyl-CoA carboxylase carboxyl transferase subunit